MHHAHQKANRGRREERARELEPLQAREAHLDAQRADTGERNTHQPLVATPQEHGQGFGRQALVFEPLVQSLERAEVRRYGPDSVMSRYAHHVICTVFAPRTG